MNSTDRTTAATPSESEHWPKGWTAVRRRRWAKLSGTAGLAAAWSAAGWTTKEVIDAHRQLDRARRHGEASTSLVTIAATYHARWGSASPTTLGARLLLRPWSLPVLSLALAGRARRGTGRSRARTRRA